MLLTTKKKLPRLVWRHCLALSAALLSSDGSQNIALHGHNEAVGGFCLARPQPGAAPEQKA